MLGRWSSARGGRSPKEHSIAEGEDLSWEMKASGVGLTVTNDSAATVAVPTTWLTPVGCGESGWGEQDGEMAEDGS